MASQPLLLPPCAAAPHAQVLSATPLHTDLQHSAAPERPPRFLALGDARGQVGHSGTACAHSPRTAAAVYLHATHARPRTAQVLIFTPRGRLVAQHSTGARQCRCWCPKRRHVAFVMIARPSCCCCDGGAGRHTPPRTHAHTHARPAGTSSGVTSLASYPLLRNESVLVTGHANGEVRTHGVAERGGARRGAKGGEEEGAAHPAGAKSAVEVGRGGRGARWGACLLVGAGGGHCVGVVVAYRWAGPAGLEAACAATALALAPQIACAAEWLWP